jgi:hypothetical protein
VLSEVSSTKGGTGEDWAAKALASETIDDFSEPVEVAKSSASEDATYTQVLEKFGRSTTSSGKPAPKAIRRIERQ